MAPLRHQCERKCQHTKSFLRLKGNILSSRVVSYWLSTSWWYFVFVQCDIRGNRELYLMKASVCQRKTDWIIKLVWEGGNMVEMGRVWQACKRREMDMWLCGEAKETTWETQA